MVVASVGCVVEYQSALSRDSNILCAKRGTRDLLPCQSRLTDNKLSCEVTSSARSPNPILRRPAVTTSSTYTILGLQTLQSPYLVCQGRSPVSIISDIKGLPLVMRRVHHGSACVQRPFNPRFAYSRKHGPRYSRRRKIAISQETNYESTELASRCRQTYGCCSWHIMPDTAC